MEDGKLPLVGARAPSLTPEGHHKKILSFFILLPGLHLFGSALPGGGLSQ
jgi:hypothetical protein